MTLRICIGRRVPKSWFRRSVSKAQGLLSFQQNIWMMISQSMSLAKRQANQSGTLKWVQTKEVESEDLNYNIEWIKIIIQGTEAQEQEEKEEFEQLYKPLGKHFKGNIKKDDRFAKHFKSKLLNPAQIEESYKVGVENMGEDDVMSKLLEMGILTHIEWIKDFDTREVEYKPDF